ncbi:HigA family addiction module antitoxin [Magnetospirillum sp. UT-4]|uniref:HigA family addiction module antitoxin n=1 Tax=Magnetospirillum sp. UT-4 TaxID=2681467 RepID=UPI0015730902|nr:HigA family addiction module antitoxin [Magnetospirillum sp. UT-4]
MDVRPNIHPGEMLREEFLKPCGVDVERLARDLNMPVERVTALVAGDGQVCTDTALRLSRYFGTTERFWLEMQLSYDLERARAEHGRIQAEVRPLGAG